MKIIRNKKTAGRIIENNAFIVIPEKNSLCKLDEVGSFIWQQLEAPKSIEELANAVFGSFSVDKQTAEKDVDEFVNALIEKEILEYD